MLHPRFRNVFSRLLRVWHRYQDAPREPERVTELAEARANLDDVRDEARQAREQFHPEPSERPQTRIPRAAITEEEYRRLSLKGVFPEG